MPKDATKNVDRYKVRGGTLNEYEVEQNKAADNKDKNMDKDKNTDNKRPTKSAAKKSPSQKAAKKK